MTQAFFRGMTALPLMMGLALGGCDISGASPAAGLREPGVTRSTEIAPPGADPGTCWGKIVSPATIETVTVQVLLQPAEVTTEGVIRQPAIYKTETRQNIVRPRRDTWFEAPCDADLTVEFVSSLQRALQARSLYRGAITGVMDARTRAAVRRYQAPEGLDSGILSLAAARKLGLVAVRQPTGG